MLDLSFRSSVSLRDRGHLPDEHVAGQLLNSLILHWAGLDQLQG
jgi:hypothetical protein